MKKTAFYPAMIVLLTTLFLFAENLTAQENEIVLELRNVEKNKSKYLHKNKNIKFTYEGNKYKGNIDSIAANSFYSEGTEYKINGISQIKIRYRTTQITGGIIAGLGLVVDGLGISILSGADESGCAAPLVMVAGIAVTAVGTVAAIAGTSVFFAGKKYDLNKNWKLNVAQINY